MFFLSQRSKDRLIGVDDRLIKIVDLALRISVVDFGIPEHGGLRTDAEQEKLYKDKKSRADGYRIKSHHQSGKAVDFYAYINGGSSWEPDHLAIVACALLQAATRLGHELDCGILWTSNKKTNSIPYGWDMSHIQLKS